MMRRTLYILFTGFLLLAMSVPSFAQTCTTDAGTISPDQTPVTLVGGTATLAATPDGNAVIPSSGQVLYLLTQAHQAILAVGTTPQFSVTDTGTFAILTLVYSTDPNDPAFFDPSWIHPGVTTVGHVQYSLSVNNTCADLDPIGAIFQVVLGGGFTCTADAGTIKADVENLLLGGGSATLIGIPQGDAVVPAGYSTIYVLTSGNNLLIEGVSATPQFTVTAVGDYTIHTLIYDADPNSPNFLDLSVVQVGVTTGIDVFNIINQNGLCASLDVAGAGFHVQPCTADAGSIKPSVANQPLVNGSATLLGLPQGDAVVPAGYSTLYVLTSGNTLVIEAVSTTPQFTVTAAGDYKIHTLIYDADPTSPDFLDLSVVVPGQTTGIDVFNLIAQNSLCASLDLAGAGFHVQPAPICTADAGTITADFSDVSLVGGSATLTATPDGNINVPAGYSTLFVLTSGNNLVIEQVAATPSFTVTSTGLFTIHTLVYDADSTSPDFLDLSVVQFGTTTGGDVVGLVTTNGICASLDVAGAPINVNACVADAGTITADFSDVSLVGGSATLTATPDGNINVPAGYSVLYVLTSGNNLVIEQVAATPSFTVTSTGLFTIHTLVYNADSTSSDFLDLSVVQFGTTTGGDVVGLV
ncbi:MAG: hypothetical protein AAFP89_11660, partial [Bacteroidota bacterium]